MLINIEAVVHVLDGLQLFLPLRVVLLSPLKSFHELVALTQLF